MIASAVEEKIYLIRSSSSNSTYLSVEDLSFYACTREPDADIRTSLFCLDDSNLINLETVPWIDGCRLASYDLSNIDCTNLLIQAEYLKENENVKMTKLIKIRKVTSVLNQIANGQFDDGGWGDPVSTAYAIFAYSTFIDAFEEQLQDGMEWLKLNRDNVDKCWPEDDCDIKTTAKVVSLLRLADYDNNKRIIHDGEIYLTTMQNKLVGTETWQLNFKPNITLDNNTPFLQCMVNDSNTTSFYMFSKLNLTANTTTNITHTPSIMQINFSAYNQRKFDVACTGNISANITTHTGDPTLIYKAGDNLTYTLPGACWSDKVKWANCTEESTLYSLLTGVNSYYRDSAMLYIQNQTITNSIGSYLDDEDIKLDGLYIFATNKEHEEKSTALLSKNSSELRWLYYQQNNDGSWGSGTALNRMDDTGYAIMAIESSITEGSDEVLEDAKDWISENEPSSGWGDIEQTALAFNALKGDIRPFVKTDPTHILLTSTVQEVLFYNPSTFNLDQITMEFSSEISKAVKIEEMSELGPDSARKIKITQTGIAPDENNGYLTIYNAGTQIGNVPVSVFKYEKIDITYPNSLTLFGKEAALKLDIVKSAATFTCDVQWDNDDISSKKSFVVSDQSSVVLDITLKNLERRQADYLGTIVCVSGTNTKKIPLVVNINQYPSKPISISPKNIFINKSEEDFTFTLQNNLNEPVSVTIKFRSSEPYYQLESSNIVLNPKADREVTVMNLIPKGMNLSKSNILEAESFGQRESITVITEIPASSLGFVLFSGIAIFIIAAMTILGLVFRQQIMSHVPTKMITKIRRMPFVRNVTKSMGTSMQEDDGEEVITKKKVDTERLKTTIIMNSIKILENLKKGEDDIKQKLRFEGFTDEDIANAYKEIEEIEKEKKKFNDQRSTIAIVETMNKNSAIIRSRLKQEGFTDRQIQTALMSLREELKDKEKKLRTELADHGINVDKDGKNGDNKEKVAFDNK
ncbi:hypothetical protein COV93_05785 [Candidatus Woesearchaeota archaeon CG11_big_fil_rev_8_21_14_0_20_43_8]|nr:MAG: hypothetical protein COV93_05785 [Candidatus Woesearchaeota archaeon CG11_big_fil_rev_8_21_14_0_20_43_8]